MTIEAFLARIYLDAAARAAFLADPVGEALRAGLPEPVARSFSAPDRAGIELAAASFAGKRSGRARPHRLRR
jgi:hypothetical protein